MKTRQNSRMKIVMEKWSKNVVVVGGANLDIVGKALQLLAPGDSTPGQTLISRGGVARNVAENLARLGLDTQLYSAVGLDTGGRTLCQETQASGVGIQKIYYSPTLPTAQYLSLVQPNGSLHAAVNDMRVLEQLTPQVLRQQGFDLSTAQALVLDCNLRADTLAWLFEQSRFYPDLLVVVDAVSAAKCIKMRAHLAQINLLKVNPLEARALTGLAVDSIADAQQAAHWFWQQGVRHTLLSLGQQGVCWCDSAGQVGHISPDMAASQVPVVNTNGAGDALLAGVVYGLLAPFSWPQSVQCGMACAALTLTVATANAEHLTLQAVTAATPSGLTRENPSHET